MAQVDVARQLRSRSASDLARDAAPVRGYAIALLGLFVIVMGIGSTWDVKWHYAVGRDSFWIPPHVLMYLSVALSGLLCAAVVLYETWRGAAAEGSARLLGFRGPLGMVVGGFGVTLILLAAPFDDLWHRWYGIDVTIWSPPHMTGVFGAAVLIFGGLVAAAHERRARPGRRADLAVLLFLMALVSNASFALIPAVRLTFWPHVASPAADPFGPNPLMYPLLASLLLAYPFVAATRIFAGRRAWLAPLAVLAAFALIRAVDTAAGQIGFALFVPWGDQTIARPPARAERALWDHLILLALPVLALALATRTARRWQLQQGAWLAGALFGLTLMLQMPPIFLARNPDDTLAPQTVALGLALAPILGAASGALGSAIGGWLSHAAYMDHAG